MVLLVLRPEPQASDMVVALTARGIAALAEPMLAVEPLDDPVGRIRTADPQADAVILTSRQTVAILRGAAGIDTLLTLPVLAVGGGTANDARAAGFTDVRSADGNSDDLVDLVATSGFRRLVHAGGRDKAGDIAGRLAAAGVTVTEAELYRAEPRDSLAPDVAAAFAEGRIDGLIVASRRSSQAFVNLVESMNLTGRLAPLRVAALSEAAAAPLRGRVVDIVVAATSTGPALLDASVALAGRLGETAGTEPDETIALPPGGEQEAEGPLIMASDDDRQGSAPGPSDTKSVKRARSKPPVIDLEAVTQADTPAADTASSEPAATPAATPSEPPASAPTEDATVDASITADVSAQAASEPSPQPARPPRTDRPNAFAGLAPLVGAALLGSVVTLAGAGLLGLVSTGSNRSDAGVDPAVLEARMSEIADRLGDGKAATADLGARLGELEAAQTATAASAARLDKAEQQLSALAAAPSVTPDTVTALAGRLTELGTTVDAITSDGAALQSRLDALAAGLDAVTAANTGTTERLATVETRIARAPEGGEIAALSLAVTSLSGKIDAGLPFASDYAIVAAAAADLPGLAELKALAATGVPTRDGLLASLPVDAMLARRPVEAGTSWMDSLLAGAKSMVNYRETGAAAVDPASSAVEAIRAALLRGDAGQAEAAAAGLPDWARPPAEDWLTALAARVRAEAAITALTARIVDRLSVPAAN